MDFTSISQYNYINFLERQSCGGIKLNINTCLYTMAIVVHEAYIRNLIIIADLIPRDICREIISHLGEDINWPHGGIINKCYARLCKNISDCKQVREPNKILIYWSEIKKYGPEWLPVLYSYNSKNFVHTRIYYININPRSIQKNQVLYLSIDIYNEKSIVITECD